MKNEEEKNEKKEKITVTPKAFFIFYFFFFVFVILFIRFYPRRTYDPTEYEKGNSYNIESNVNNNYSYYCTVSIDGKESVYSGKRNGDYELISYNGNKYFRNLDNYFIYDSIWICSDNPNKYSYFVDGQNFFTILGNSKYESVTEYESGKDVYSFVISTDTLNSLLNGEEPVENSIDDNNSNGIQVTMNDNGALKKVIYSLNNYCINNNSCEKELKIEVSYDDIDSVDKIDNPIG